MREIKFRAWDNLLRQMMTNIENAVIMARRSEFEVMQYTGLKDKNSKEIYEGDIVNFIEYGHPRIGEVIYKEEGAAWNVHFKFGDLDPMDILICSQGMSGFEVIGNIYESPELLKG